MWVAFILGLKIWKHYVLFLWILIRPWLISQDDKRGKYTRCMPWNFNSNIGARNAYIKKLAYNIDFQGHMYIKVFANNPTN